MLDPQLHTKEEVLRQYAAGGLPENLLAPLEEHLLICEVCRQRLDDVEFAQCTREAALRIALDDETRVTQGFAARLWAALTAVPKPAWAAAAAAAAVLLFVGPRLTGPTEFEAVTLRALRGADDGSSAVASGKAVRFEIDLTEIPAAPAFVVEMADSSGSTLWKDSVTPNGNSLSVPIARKLDRGRYWIRLYAGGNDPRLLREFGLIAR